MSESGNDLISHAERLRYRVAVLDGPQGQGASGPAHRRTRIDASRVGLLHPLGTPRHGAALGSASGSGLDPKLNRYIVYLQQSIAGGTHWAVFENNGPTLWGKVANAVESFLLGEWQAGYLAGSSPSQAFFVHCDATTMTQSDLDNGRLVCEVGVALVQPARFASFRIGQWTARHRP